MSLTRDESGAVPTELTEYSTTARGGPRLVGRERELAAVRTFLGAQDVPGTLVVTGDPGVGKTALWATAIEAASGAGWRIMTARASHGETLLDFAGLIDLFEGVDVGQLADVPSPQRNALDVALLRNTGDDAAAAPQAIGMGLLNSLRSLSSHRPVPDDDRARSADCRDLDPRRQEGVGQLAYLCVRVVEPRTHSRAGRYMSVPGSGPELRFRTQRPFLGRTSALVGLDSWWRARIAAPDDAPAPDACRRIVTDDQIVRHPEPAVWRS